MIKRFAQNPIIRTTDITPSRPDMVVECVLNPGVFTCQNKTWLLLRVAERPIQVDGKVSFPIMENNAITILSFDKNDPKLDLSDARMVAYDGKMYLSTLSHLRLYCSDDDVHFYEPKDMQTTIFGEGELETFGIEDCRVSQLGDTYHLTFTQVSENGVGVGYMTTKDWIDFTKHGMIIPPHNKDCALFEEKIDGKYYCLHRPSGIGLGGNFIWIASSPDLIHWGNHTCIARTRKDSWDCARIGAGASPILTEEGWLEIYHGADHNHKYCLGAILLDKNDPTIVLARSEQPLFSPEEDYELNGFFGNVVFTNGHKVDGDRVTMYYGASDEVICMASFQISDILATLKPQTAWLENY